MNRPTHILGGASMALIISTMMELPDISLIGTMTISAGLGALLPDIDKKNTTISNKHPVVSFFVRLFTTHRGFTHSFLALIMLAYPLYLLVKTVGSVYLGYAVIGILLGYMSHLMLDMFNPEGIPLFFPFKFKVSLAPIKTGGLIEHIIRVALLVLIVFLLYAACTKNIERASGLIYDVLAKLNL